MKKKQPMCKTPGGNEVDHYNTQEHKATTNRLITQEPAKLSLWSHSIIAKKSSLVRERKPYVEKSREMPIIRNKTGSPAEDKNSCNIT